MKFWDASALVPLLVAEPTTRALQALAVRDSDMLVWWGSPVECVSALARLERDAALDGRQVRAAYERLDELAQGWHEIGPGEMVRETAMRFLRVHPLRAADALQFGGGFCRRREPAVGPGGGDPGRPPRGRGAQGGLRRRGGVRFIHSSLNTATPVCF